MRRLRGYWCETCGVSTGPLTRAETRAERAAGHKLTSYSLPPPGLRERSAAALYRAGYHRWAAEKGYPALAGNDPLSGTPWRQCAGRRGHEGHPEPTAREAVALSRLVSKAKARFWLAQAAELREQAERIERGTRANPVRPGRWRAA